MSGSSGSSGGGDFTPDRQDCSQLVLETQLSSPKPTVVAGLQVDQVLAVEVRNMNGSANASSRVIASKPSCVRLTRARSESESRQRDEHGVGR